MTRVAVLLAAGGEDWEAPALAVLGRSGAVVLKRCLDLSDLLASAATGQADVAVVSGVLGGLDADAVMQLLRHDVRTVAVGGEADALGRLGVVGAVPRAELDTLGVVVIAAGAQDLVLDPSSEPGPHPRPDAVAGSEPRTAPGWVVAVHGPTGAPGRTTLALGLAALHADGGRRTVLVDADPYGGAVAQHLGVLDEVSGLLAAARLANTGSLDAPGFARCRRVVAEGLEVVTGLPRPDRWVEARAGVLEAVVEQAVSVGDVVVDTGFSLEDDDAVTGRPISRNQLTLDALALADAVVLVGAAEPTGLARLARSLVELRDLGTAPVVVVVNRMRDTLGWSRRDIAGMVEGYLRPAAVCFVPEDRAVVDKALVAGRSVVELGDSAIRRALSEVHDAVFARVPSAS